MSVEAEVAFGLEGLGMDPAEINERIGWALSVVGMSEFRNRSPFHLSAGQKQRTAIAAILAMTPRILVLDEPTASLDPLGKTEVFRVVRELRQRQGMTIIMVSQESEHIAEFSDRVIVLHKGRVELEGRPQDIFSQVQTMQNLGLSIPQVSELGQCLNAELGTDYRFTDPDDAYEILIQAADENPSR
jgi:energy-coupling factor transporter ATP-binding protein EcfA2